jgi:hypothetical protein
MRKAAIALLTFGVLAFGQPGTVHVIGPTVSGLDAIVFNGSTLLGTTAGSIKSGALYSINPSTGAGTLIGNLVGATNPSLTYAITGLAVQPGTGTLFGATSKNSTNSPNNLVTVNPSTGQVTVIGPFNVPTNQGPADITFTPDGKLYGWIEPNTDSVALINISTGAATVVGSSGLSTFGSGIASNATGTVYYAGFGTGKPLKTINLSTGAATDVVTMTAGANSGDAIAALAFSPGGVLFGIEGGDVSTTRLITIDLAAAPPPPPSTPIPPTVILTAMGMIAATLYFNRRNLPFLRR